VSKRSFLGVDLNESTKLSVVLVSDDQMLCDGLRALFSQDSTIEVIGETTDGPKAQERVRDLKPDLVVTDIASWAAGGMETIRGIVGTCPDTKIMVISPFCSKAFITQVLSAGAHGYIARQNGFDELLQGIKTLSSGAAFLCSRAREVVLGDYATTRNSGKPDEAALSEREATILQLLAEGQTSKQIGLALDISSKTVDASRRRLMKKLEVESLADLVKCAIVLGLTTLAPQRPSGPAPKA